MEESVRRAVADLVRQYGTLVCVDVRRCEGLLKDLCGPHAREIRVLTEALREGVPGKLADAARAGEALGLVAGRLVANLDHLGMKPELARWSVEVWAEALGFVVPRPTLAGAPAPTGAADPTRSRVATAPHAALGPVAPRPALRQAAAASSTLAFVRIPSGNFTIGSSSADSEAEMNERPSHMVTITRPFELLATPVTQSLWTSVMRTNPSQFKGADRPVESVSWLEAVSFCNALSRSAGLEEAYVVRGDTVQWKGLTSGSYRLPTEAEWEYGARAGTTASRYGSLDDIAWYGRNAGRETHSVAQRAANAFGLYDMFGNVWEWCWDRYSNYSGAAAKDPIGGDSDPYRVIRGGSWNCDVRRVRAAYRAANPPSYRFDALGFRLARG